MANESHVKPMYNANVQRVVGVQFGVMSPEEIRRRSVVEVVRRECYSGDNPIIEQSRLFSLAKSASKKIYPGRLATISISTSDSRASPVTPIQVRAGKRPAGK